jgi:hypothetical protein
MPLVIVLADCARTGHKEVVMQERVVSAHLDSEHSSAQLIQRLGWAIVDATDLEQAATPKRSVRDRIAQLGAQRAF